MSSVDSIGIDHWHLPDVNRIEVAFYRMNAAGELGMRSHTPTAASLARLMKLVWQQTLCGWWTMRPCSAGSTRHQTYFVEVVPPEMPAELEEIETEVRLKEEEGT